MEWLLTGGHVSTSLGACKRVLLVGFVLNLLKCVKCLEWYIGADSFFFKIKMFDI